MSMTIREMSTDDLDAVSALEAAVFTMPWSKNGFSETLCREDAHFFTAYEDERLLGYAGVYCTADEGEITNVAVAPEARRQGVARALLQHLLTRLLSDGITRAVLEVRVSNTPAIRLYEAQGFQIAGRRKGFYEKPAEDAYVMVSEPVVSYGMTQAAPL